MSFDLGQLRVNRVGEFDAVYLPPNALFPNCDPRFWAEAKRIVNPRTVDVERDLLINSMHSFLLQVDGLNILIDTCNGNHRFRTGFAEFANDLGTEYLQNLKKHGVEPQDVDFVFCTHFHFDHIGWNTQLENGSWVPTFPRARYLFSKVEYEHFSHLWQSNPEFPGINSFEDSISPIVSAGLAELIDPLDGYELGKGLTLEAAPGHTPGHAMLCGRAAGSFVLFAGDVLHHPLQLLDPKLCLPDEFDSALGLETRLALIERCTDAPVWLMTGHCVAPSGGRIVRRGEHLHFSFLDE